MTEYDKAHIERIFKIAEQYEKRNAKFSLYQRLFRMSFDEKMAYKFYKNSVKR